MLADLETGKIQGIMKLAPVMHWLIRHRPALGVVQEGITQEQLGVAVRLGNETLGQAINAAQARLRRRGCWTNSSEMVTDMIRCIHLFTGKDGQSHVEETTIPS